MASVGMSATSISGLLRSVKVSLRSLAPLQPEVEVIALKGCGKVGDETVIGEPIAQGR